MNAAASVARAIVSGLMAWLVIQGLLFVLMQAVPGGPAAALAGDFATRETQAEVARSFALDQPKATQFAAFVANMARGDWGISYHFRRPVSTLIIERLWPTLLLMLGALPLALIAGRAIGLWAAAREGGGTVVALLASAAYALPVFWVGQVLMLSAGLELRWFPVSGLNDPRQAGAGAITEALDLAWHAVLPVTTLALQQSAFFATIAHAKARLEMGQGYVRAARARGLPEGAIVWRHVARNVAPQLAVVALNRLGMLFTGAVLVETLFAWPGLGRLMAAAILNRDHPVLLGAFALVVAAVIVGSMLADIAQGWLDPRVNAEQVLR